MKTKSNIRLGRDDKILYGVIFLIMFLWLIAVCYPLLFVLSCSFSSGRAITNGKVLLFPVEPTVDGYKVILQYKQVWVGYANTIIITVVGTLLNMLLTILAAYPLSRRDFKGRGIYMTILMITMFLSGGMIPNYILMSNLHLLNTRWSVILSGAISVTNTIIMRTYFQNSIPYDLFEAARLDGITDFGYLTKIVLPLSKSILAVICLYYAVGHWNGYFNAMLYIRDQNLYPLQVVLREIMNVGNLSMSGVEDPEVIIALQNASNQMKYALIVVSAAPLLIVYPFVQKYFEKGVMIGSVKG